MGFQIGENIRKVHELRNYTQEYMAQQLGISQKTYSKIEHDRTKLDKEQLNSIARILDIDPVKLLTFDEKVLLNKAPTLQLKQEKSY